MHPNFLSKNIDSYTCTLISINTYQFICIISLYIQKSYFSNASGNTWVTSLTSSDDSFNDTALDSYSIVHITSDLDRTIDIISDSEISEMVSVVS